MPLRILCVGDMHLGRLPARLPASLVEARLDPRELGPAAAWRSTVDQACALGVDAVVLAGDVVDSANRRFEAFGPLQRGVQRLLDHGIQVHAVSGNHDGDTLPRLAAEAGLQILGPGGTWTVHALGAAGGPQVRLLGWSFPSSSVRTSPLAQGLPDLSGAGPVLGVLHCDLDQPDSPYAPVRSTELAGRGVAQWLLGHVHKPTLSEGDTDPGYLGSLVGLDPSETGLHGPWLVTVENDGSLRKRHLPLAPLRWERRDVPVDGLQDVRAGLAEHLLAALRSCQAELASELKQVRALGCRLRLTGRVPAHRELLRTLAAEDPTALQLESGGTLLFVADLEDASVPARDLRLLARGDEPPALLASDLLALEARDERGEELIAAARVPLEQRAAEPNFVILEPFEAADETVRELLLKAGYEALDELLAQREGEA